MNKIKFVTDSASDITVDYENQHENLLVMNYKVTLCDKGFTSRVDMSNEDFYKELADTDEIPTTSQLTFFEFSDVFEQLYSERYRHVIVTLINAEASATVGNAVAAKNDFFVNHPEAKDMFTIDIIDSRTYTGGYGYTVMRAVEMEESGSSYDDILRFMNDEIEHSVIYFVPFTLKYAQRSGRIPGALAAVGETLGIKPIMRIYDHKIVNSDMVRGEKKIYSKIALKVINEMEDKSPYCVVYGSVEKDADIMSDVMEKLCGYPPASFFRINPIVSSHSGPHVIGIIFREKE